MKKTDKLFNSPIDRIVDFSFDDKVANVFEDMINRSIPGYSSVISMIGMLAGKYVQANSNCYDLGTSLGAAAFALQKNIRVENCKVIAVDNSKAMIQKAEKYNSQTTFKTKIETICDDIRNIKIEKASIVVLNYTLQFIPKNERKELLQKIFNGMNSNGILVLSEKITFDDESLNKRLIEKYHNFKRQNGYSDLEISQKRDALENVLIPETIENHKLRLANCGFKTADVCYQFYNFISIVAQK